MEDKELESIIQQLLDEGRDDAFIEQVVQQYEADKAGKTPAPAVEGTTEVPEVSGVSDLEEPSLASPTPEEEVEQHNIRQDVVAGSIAAVTNIPKGLIGTTASLMNGFNQIISGIPKAEAGLKLAIGEAFNPEEAEVLRQDPKLRNALYDVLGGDAGNELGETLDAAAVRSNRSIVENYLTGNIAEGTCLLYTSPSPRDATLSRMPSSA